MEKPSPSWGTGSAFRAFSSGLSSRSSKIRVMWTPRGAGPFAAWGGSVGFFSSAAGGASLLSTPLAGAGTGFSALVTSGFFSGEGADLWTAGPAVSGFFSSLDGVTGFFSAAAGGAGLLSVPLEKAVTGFSALGVSGFFSAAVVVFASGADFPGCSGFLGEMCSAWGFWSVLPGSVALFPTTDGFFSTGGAGTLGEGVLLTVGFGVSGGLTAAGVVTVVFWSGMGASFQVHGIKNASQVGTHC